MKAQGRETRLLTTQLYFPNEPLNAHDLFFRDDLIVRLERGIATFNFVLRRPA